MLSTNNIYWVAAFLEGEGYFGINKGTPRIYVNQTDRDVVEKLRDIVDPKCTIGMQTRDGNRQDIYRFWVYGALAASWMMTIYPLMGIRRKQTIKEILEFWKADSGSLIRINKNLAIDLARMKKITIKEAELFLRNHISHD